MGQDAEVLVIGAGMAGLCAASELTRRGRTCLVLEGRPRIGGRVWTRSDPGSPAPAELGAEFIHGYPEQTLRLIDSFGLAAYEVPDEHLLAMKGRIRKADDFWERIEPALTGRPPGRKDLSNEAFLRRKRMKGADRKLARSFIEGFHAADPALISQKALAVETDAADKIDGNRASRLWGGYGALVESLRASLPPERARILPGAAVQRIDWKPGRVEARDARGRSYSARAAILTAPPGPLSRIEFAPDIPEKWVELEHLATGPVIKIALRFNHLFWEKKLGHHFGFIHSDERFFPTWWSPAPFRWPVLTGWTGGPAAHELSGRGLKELLDRAARSLGRFLGRKPSALLQETVSVQLHDWQADPFSQGAYGFVREGGMGAPERLARPIRNTLFFAGESTEGAGLTGTVESAIQSGLRAARQYRR